MTATLIVPGLNDSPPGHWQTWLQDRLPDAVRVSQPDWGLPDLASWSRLIAAAIDASPTPPIIVAHSFGVLASVHAVPRASKRIAAAMLVAPADPEVFGYANQLPKYPLPYPAVLVGSQSDPWMTFDAVSDWADRWSTRLVDLGNAGHVNVDSGHGEWSRGLAIYRQLEREVRPTEAGRARVASLFPRV